MSASLGKRKRLSTIQTKKQVEGPASFASGYGFLEALKERMDVGDLDGIREVLQTFISQISSPTSIPSGSSSTSIWGDTIPSTTDPRVKMVSDYLNLSSGAAEVWECWELAHRANNLPLLPVPLTLLSTILNLLQPLPFFHSLFSPIILPTFLTHSRQLHSVLNSSNKAHLRSGLVYLTAVVKVSGKWGDRVWEEFGTEIERTGGKGNRDGGKHKGGGWGKMLTMSSAPVDASGRKLKLSKLKESSGASTEEDPFELRPSIKLLSIDFLCTLLSSSTSTTLTTTALLTSIPQLPYQLSKALVINPSSDIRSTEYTSEHVLVVKRVIKAFETLWLSQPRISKNLKIAAFGDDLWTELVKVWAITTSLETVEIVKDFLYQMCTKPGTGVCFPSNGWYGRLKSSDDETATVSDGKGGVHNRILAGLLKNIGREGWTSEVVGLGEFVRDVCFSSGELVSAYWSHSNITLEPRLSSKFLISTSHLQSIISLPVPSSSFLLPSSSSTQTFRTVPPPLNSTIENILPSIFPKQFSSKGLSPVAGTLVKLTTASTLSRCLDKFSKVQDEFKKVEAALEEGPSGLWASRRSQLDQEMRKRVPDLSVVIAFVLEVAKGDEEDDKAKSRKAVMTESALRLLSLYYRTLPGLVLQEERAFDVGKLLVGAEGVASTSADTKGKAKVIAEEDASASWGFARANLEGINALSQLHVLRLIGQGGSDFNWSARAGSSPHSYIYHLFSLYLLTPSTSVATKSTTFDLILRLLENNVMFEHDQNEVFIWLEALSASSTSSAGELSLDDATLLNFMEDCIKRCLKTLHRYLEESLQLLPSTGFSISDFPSPLLMTVIEQLGAKIKAKVISESEVVPILRFVRKLVLSLTEKQPDCRYMRAALEKIEQSVGSLGDALKEEPGAILPCDVPDAQDERFEAFWNSEDIHASTVLVSFNNAFLHALPSRLCQPQSMDLLGYLIKSDLNLQPSRSLRLILHRMQGLVSEIPVYSQSIAACITLLSAILKNSRFSNQVDQKLKSVVFENPSIESLLKSTLLNEAIRKSLSDLISALDPKSDGDRLIAAPQTEWVSDILLRKQFSEVQTYAGCCSPWVPFLDIRTLDAILTKILALIQKDETGEVASGTSQLLGQLFDVLGSSPPKNSAINLVLDSLPTLLSLRLLSPAAKFVGKALPLAYQSTLCLPEKLTISALFNNSSTPIFSSNPTGPKPLKSDSHGVHSTLFPDDVDEARAELITPLLYQSPSARSNFEAWLSNVDKKTVTRLASVSKPLASFLDIALAHGVPSKPSKGLKSSLKAIPVLLAAFTDPTTSAQNRQSIQSAVLLLVQLFPDEATTLSSQIAEVSITTGPTAGVCDFFLQLLKLQKSEFLPAIQSYLSITLAQVTDAFSSTEFDTPEMEKFTETFTAFVSCTSQALVFEPHLVDPVLSAITQSRFTRPLALSLASALAARVIMKPMDVVRHLKTLLAHKDFSIYTLRSSYLDDRTRTVFVQYIRSIWDMSPATCCQPANIEPLLDLYRGTIDQADSLILSIFHLFERYRRMSVTSLLIRWSPDGSKKPVATTRAFHVVQELDPQIMLNSCISFPIQRRFNPQSNYSQNTSPGDDQIYDPLNILSLFACTLQDNELTPLEWVEILRSNVLGLAVSALSSKREDMRQVGSYILSTTEKVLQQVEAQEQPQVLYILDLLRQSIPTQPSSADAEEGSMSLSSFPRVPPLVTLFFVHALRAVGNPASFLYPHVSRFMLQRSKFDSHDVPLLFGLLYSSDDAEWKQERTWILRFIRDGMKSSDDWRILQRRHTFSLIATIYQSSTEAPLKRLIIECISQFTADSTACLSLVRQESFLSWVGIQVKLIKSRDLTSVAAAPAMRTFLRLMENVVIVCGGVEAQRRVNDKKGNGHPQEENEEDVEMDTPEGDEPKVSKKHGVSTRRFQWIQDVSRLVMSAVSGCPADLDNVATSCKIALRLAMALPPVDEGSLATSSAIATFKSVSHLFTFLVSVISTSVEPTLSTQVSTAVPPEPQSAAWTARTILSAPLALDNVYATWSSSVESLFRVGMQLGPALVEREDLDVLGRRVISFDGKLGAWVRKEWVRGSLSL